MWIRVEERLTKRVGNGVQYDNGEYIITCYPENNNLNPVDKMAVKLCELEDKIESNTLIELPCAVGDTVYVLDDYVAHDECCKCEHYRIGGFGDPSECGRTKYGFKHPDCIQIVEETATLGSILRWITPSLFTEKIDFGKTVFLTKEEAEKALAERNKNEKV